MGIVNHTFGLLATRVLDPVFIANPNIYDELIDKSSAKQSPLEEGGVYRILSAGYHTGEERGAALYFRKTGNAHHKPDGRISAAF